MAHLKGFSPTLFHTLQLPSYILITHQPTYVHTYLLLIPHLPSYIFTYLLHTSHLPSYIITYLPISTNLSLGGTIKNITPQIYVTHPILRQHRSHIKKQFHSKFFIKRLLKSCKIITPKCVLVHSGFH